MDILHEVRVIKERAVLVSLRTSATFSEESVADFSFLELKQLAETANVECVAELTQNRPRIDTKWFLGKGKVEELKQLIDVFEADTAIFDAELSGGQVRNLEQFLDVKIIDRTQLILDIFASRAKTREGILQVELAQLNYLLPRLSGHGKNLSRLGGGIGTRGPGETKLETDRRHIRTKISDIKARLTEVNRHRSLYRERRRKNGMFQIALVGYTNAGKSTLLNRLTQSDVLAEDKLFATLDPTSRMLILPSGKQLLLTDTVGFIQRLPHDLVAAFRATLEEVCEADLILHVVDSSSPMRELQKETVERVLEELDAHRTRQLVVFNKTDLLDVDDMRSLIDSGDSIRVSAFSNEDLQSLLNKLQDLLAGGQVQYKIPIERGDLLAALYRLGEVVETSTDGDFTFCRLVPDSKEYERHGYLLERYRQNDALREQNGAEMD